MNVMHYSVKMAYSIPGHGTRGISKQIPDLQNKRAIKDKLNFWTKTIFQLHSETACGHYKNSTQKKLLKRYWKIIFRM